MGQDRGCHKYSKLLMNLCVVRTLPDGSRKMVRPFHISMEGRESFIICRDDEDYDVMVKTIAVGCRRKNVVLIIHAVVSNHFHLAVLADCQASAYEAGEEIKRVYSMWLHSKYGIAGALDRADVQAIPLETSYHVRNALAYIPRNALDNKCNVKEYPWSGYSAMFNSIVPAGCKAVSSLSKRLCMEFLHTCMSLKNVPWLLDSDLRLVPRSFCDWEYLEQAFEHDPAYWLRTVGGVNSAQMQEMLIDGPREMKPDTEVRKLADELSQKWFGRSLDDASMEQRGKLMYYFSRMKRTTVSQMARVFEMAPERVRRLLNK